jgi:hypothetical protein
MQTSWDVRDALTGFVNRVVFFAGSSEILQPTPWKTCRGENVTSPKVLAA